MSADLVAAVGWGALAASSLILGAVFGLARKWPERLVGAVLAFGAGALISAVSFDLAEEGAQIGDPGYVAIGLAAGAVTFYVVDGAFDRGGTNALAIGAFLDGIPEQLVLGIGLAAGDGVSLGLLIAIFVSNLPEAIGSADAMRAAGTRPAAIRRLWGLIAIGCLIATPVGFALADVTGGNLQAAINGFAAGALLVMLVDSMIPEAVSKAGRAGGLVTVLGFAVAAGLSGIG
jgi:zinc transporter, ZIP family